MFDIISVAHAEAPAGGAAMGNIIFMILLFAIFYFLLIRPQQKQQKAHKEMVNNLKRGDSVITSGGMLGKIHKVDEDTVTLEVGEVEVSNKTYRPMRVKYKRNSIGSVTVKSDIADTEENKEKKD
ncbi:MAG: preprotein translocase subunit YajC [Magnetococcales bacterium]|nr:preprotein translocase subunit YajC [Magnetococcales bacterium]